MYTTPLIACPASPSNPDITGLISDLEATLSLPFVKGFCQMALLCVPYKASVVTEDGMTYLFISADDNNVDDDMMMCPHVSS